jgi:hypothetical protein
MIAGYAPSISEQISFLSGSISSSQFKILPDSWVEPITETSTPRE